MFKTWWGKRRVRSYILTSKEREILKAFLERGQKLEGFRLLLFNARRSLPKLREDLLALESFLRAAEERASHQAIGR
jgi:hypothetical protein